MTAQWAIWNLKRCAKVQARWATTAGNYRVGAAPEPEKAATDMNYVRERIGNAQKYGLQCWCIAATRPGNA